MGDAKPIRTLRDYSKPSYEGYRNTIEFPVGNNVVPLRSDTIRLVQNGCSFHGLRSKDPNQHLKDFLKLVDSLDLDDENRERTRLRSITTWEDLTTHFLAQFFLSGRTTKLCNDILMFQQHQGEYLSEAWTHFKDLLQKIPHHGIDLWLQVQIFYDHVNPVTRRTIDQSAGGKIRDRNAKESWALLEDLALYDNENVPSTSDCRLIKLENQVQRLMEAHLAPTQPTQVNKITTSCEICNGHHDTQYCIEDPKQAFVEYASSHTDKAGVYLQCSSHPSTLINAIKTCSKEANISQISQLQPRMGIGTQQPEEPEPTLEDEFQDLHLNLLVLEVLARAPIYNAILDKYVESLELGKNGSAFVQGEVSAKMEDPRLFTVPFIDCRMAKIAVGEGITRSVFDVKGVDLVLSSDLTNKIAWMKFLIENEEEFFTDAGDGVGINTRRRRVSRNVIFDEKKLESSSEVSLDDS
ncbi:MAK10-like protein [Tanacetum coccineum]